MTKLQLYRTDRMNIQPAPAGFPAMDNHRDVFLAADVDAEIKRLQGTLRVVAGLIHDALPSAQGSAAESLAHAYEAIETTLHGVAAEPAPDHLRDATKEI